MKSKKTLESFDGKGTVSPSLQPCKNEPSQDWTAYKLTEKINLDGNMIRVIEWLQLGADITFLMPDGKRMRLKLEEVV